MRFLFCGTAAAEAWPALFCACEACLAARAEGGRDLRSRAAYMVGERVRIDWGPDSLAQMQRFALAYERLEHLLVTHSHWDHWVPEELAYRRPGFSRIAEGNRLRIYGNPHVRARGEAALAAGWEAYALEFHDLRLFEPIPLGEGLTATPVEAAHARGEACVNYLLEREGRCLMQGNDTGWWPESTWEFLSGRRLDMLLLDCTHGPREASAGHLSVETVVATRDELAKRGALAPDARVIATHFSHNGGWLHERLEAYFEPYAIEVAFDGMSLEL